MTNLAAVAIDATSQKARPGDNDSKRGTPSK
jgi:hypothetical protein